MADKEENHDPIEESQEEFGELIRYTGAGFISGFILGVVLDYFGFQRSGVGQWIVRTFSGEGESIFEGLYAFRKRLQKSAGSMAEAYGWGKLFGMAIPWIIDGISRLMGVNVYGVEAFYIPYFYALGDQMGANVSGFIYLRKKEASLGKALGAYFRHPVMLSSLAILLIVPIGLSAARIAGFSPTTQTSTALETIAANLCWLPPFVGWLREKLE